MENHPSRNWKQNSRFEALSNSGSARKPQGRGRFSTVDLLVLTSLDQLHTFIKQATLMRRSTILSLPIYFVLLASNFDKLLVKGLKNIVF